MALLRKWGPWAALLLVAAVVLAVGLNRPSHPSLDARASSIETEVRCPVCNGETVAESQSAPAVEIRNQIRQDLQAGESESQILSGLVRSYGPSILEKPQASGIGVVVWVVPVIAVVVAVSGLVLLLRRWRVRSRSGADDSLEPPVPGEGAGDDPGSRDPASGPPGGVASGAPGGSASGAVVPAAAVGSASGPPGAVGGNRAVPELVAGAGGGVATAVAADPADRSAQPRPASPGDTPPDGAATGGKAKRWGRGPKWALTGTGIALVAAGASWAVVASSGTRLPGQSITGDVLPAQAVTQHLQAASADVQKKDVVGALKEYEKVLKVEPKQAEALTGMGWLLAQTGQPSLLQQGLGQLAAAEQADPTYAPAHLYRGIALIGEGDYAASIPELQWYLGHDPDPQLVPQVKKALAEAQAKAANPAAGPASGPAGSGSAGSGSGSAGAGSASGSGG